MKKNNPLFIFISTLMTLMASLTLNAQVSQKQNLAPLEGFSNPWQIEADLKQEILDSYSHVDQGRMVPTAALKDALIFFEINKASIPKKEYIVVIDYSKPSNQNRFHIVQLSTGQVRSFKTSHGKGSDPNHTGRAHFFSNTENSNMTSLGFYLTGQEYFGSFRKALRMHGLSMSNSKAFERAIVIHGAPYVDQETGSVGRSQGCPALDFKHAQTIMNLIKDGTLIYSWAG